MKIQRERVCVGDLDRKSQSIIIAQIVRNKYVLDYLTVALDALKSSSHYRQRVKKMTRELEGAIEYYYGDLRAQFTSGTIQPWEVLQDAAYEYWRELKKMVGYHEQATIRVMQRARFPDINLLQKVSTAKSLLNIVSMCDCVEVYHNDNLSNILFLGTRNPEIASLCLEDERTRYMRSSMGHFQKSLERLNKEIIKHYGIRDGVIMDQDVERTYNISTERIIDTMFNYGLINVLMEDEGHTLEEAKEIIKERTEAAEKREKKEKEKAELKAAKREHKLSTKTTKQ